MKKISTVLIIAILAFATGCASAPQAAPGPQLAPIPAAVQSAALKDSPITMANIDDFLGRSEFEVVDLRNFEDRFNGGYIMGTETIPFFQFLENRMVTRGGSTWDITKAKVNDAFPYANFFDPNKKIILFCASGTRAAFVKAILDTKGYTTYNAGGFKDYKGPRKVLGDGEYKLPAPAAH